MYFALRILCVLVCWVVLSRSAEQIVGWKNGDRVLFPEQIDYLQKQLKYCKSENLILWGDGRCYKENEPGPCYAGRVLAFDKKLLRPYCKEI